MLIKVIKPTMEISFECPGIVHQFKQIKPKIKVIPILWKVPQNGWVKYNTNGVSRGNPARSSWEFCLRDSQGDLIHAEGAIIEDPNSMEAKAMAILHAAIHSKILI